MLGKIWTKVVEAGVVFSLISLIVTLAVPIALGVVSLIVTPFSPEWGERISDWMFYLFFGGILFTGGAFMMTLILAVPVRRGE